MEKKILKIGLCKGRHEIKEVSDYFFDEIKDPMNFVGLEKMVGDKLDNLDYFEELHLYVTGLTTALIAVLNVVANCKVILYHFDRETGEYKDQEFPMTSRLSYLESACYGM